MRPLDFLFNPGSVAIIGAAHTEEKLGGIILKNLLKFRGKVYPVNPKYTELMGLKAYPSISDIPEPVDISLIIRPSSEVPDILKLHKGKAKCVIIVTSGFAETGHEALQEEIKKIGMETGVRLLGPNCMGLYNPKNKLDTLLLPDDRVLRPKKGNVAIISQSGAVIHCLFGIFRNENIGVSGVITYGNAIDIDEYDLYEYFLNDKKTDVVISYIESVRDGRRFLDMAKQLSEKKSLVVLKSGKGAGGQAAAYSHTGRLAGRYEVFHSIMRQFNISEVNDFDELVDAVKALSYQRPFLPPTSKAGHLETDKCILIITNGGGSGVLASDECMRQGLEIAPLSEEKIKRLKEVFPDFYVIRNPLDLTAQVSERDYIVALKELKDDYDGFLIVALTGVAGITPQFAELIKEIKTELNKPLVMHMSCGCETEGFIAKIEKAGIPVYQSPERAVRGLKALLR